MHHSSFRIAPERERATYEGLLELVARGLEAAHARNVKVEANGLSFSGGMFRLVTGWNLLWGITRGRVRVDAHASRIDCSISFVQLMVAGILLCGVMITGALVTGDYDMVWAVVLMPSLGVGVQYVIARAAFSHFMRQCIHDAGFLVEER